MPETTTPQLTETQLAEIEVRTKLPSLSYTDVDYVLERVPALIRDWRALRELAYVPKILPDDERLTYRDEAERLLRQNTAMREQLQEEQRRNQTQAESIMELEADVTSLRTQLASAKAAGDKEESLDEMEIPPRVDIFGIAYSSPAKLRTAAESAATAMRDLCVETMRLYFAAKHEYAPEALVNQLQSLTLDSREQIRNG